MIKQCLTGSTILQPFVDGSSFEFNLSWVQQLATAVPTMSWASSSMRPAVSTATRTLPSFLIVCRMVAEGRDSQWSIDILVKEIYL